MLLTISAAALAALWLVRGWIWRGVTRLLVVRSGRRMLP
jgi:hypothetical protein